MFWTIAFLGISDSTSIETIVSDGIDVILVIVDCYGTSDFKVVIPKPKVSVFIKNFYFLLWYLNNVVHTIHEIFWCDTEGL